MLELKKDGTFDNETYLIVWFPGAEYEIVNKSAKVLNNAEVFAQYTSAFE